jgi:hypothetical protein
MQVVVSRMLRESLVFFILLGIMSIGFVQSLLALDAADGVVQDSVLIVNILIQALLGSPDFDSPKEKFGPPFGLILYYSFSFVSAVILLNILIALFNTAYSDIYEDATNQYLGAYSFKTISMIRAPDSFVYPAPFNIIEFFFIAPLEFIMSKKAYAKVSINLPVSVFRLRPTDAPPARSNFTAQPVHHVGHVLHPAHDHRRLRGPHCALEAVQGPLPREQPRGRGRRQHREPVRARPGGRQPDQHKVLQGALQGLP